jgi:uncharacterized integral membrane protein
MSMLHRNRNDPVHPPAPAPPTTPAPGDLSRPAENAPANRVPRTRTHAAWLAICTAAVAFVVLIVFMLQNTRSVEVTFLWMRGSLPLALALLVAGVGTALLAIAVGAARIGQLRRLSRRDHEAAATTARPSGQRLIDPTT